MTPMTPAELAEGRHPGIAHIAQFFTCEHLPPHLQVVSKPFCDLAGELLSRLPDGPELVVALRKLLESKDAAVRHLVALGAD